jgi:hypothetical protein
MARLRTSLLAGGAGVIALVGTTALAVPASAALTGTYQFGQDGTFPVGTMTLAKPDTYSDSFLNGTTDSGVWHKTLTGGIKIKITVSTEQLDVGCILRGPITSTGFGSSAAPGKYTCPSGATGTWYAVTSSGSTPSPVGLPSTNGWGNG